MLKSQPRRPSPCAGVSEAGCDSGGDGDSSQWARAGFVSETLASLVLIVEGNSAVPLPRRPLTRGQTGAPPLNPARFRAGPAPDLLCEGTHGTHVNGVGERGCLKRQVVF